MDNAWLQAEPGGFLLGATGYTVIILPTALLPSRMPLYWIFVRLTVRSTATWHPRKTIQSLLVHIMKKGTICKLRPHILA
jgi:hypothetical protein